MANNFIQVPPQSTGLKLQTFENTVGGNVVESEAVTLVRSLDNTEVGTAAQPIRVDPVGTTTQPVSGTVTSNQGASAWTVKPDGTVWTLTGTSGNVNVTNTVATTLASTTVTNTVAVSGTVTANQGTANATPWNENLAQVGGATFALGQQLAAAALPVVLTAAQLTTLTPLTTVAVTQSTSPWVENISQFGGTNISTGTGVGGAGIPRVTVSSDSFPAAQAVTLPAGQAVELLDSAGTNKASISAAGALKVDGSAVTQPVSLTSTTITGNVTVVQPTGTNLHVVVDTAPTTAVTLPAGQAVELLDSGGTNKASITASGALKIDGSGTTQAVSQTGVWTIGQAGTWTNTVTQASGANLHVNIDNLPANASQETGGNLATLVTQEYFNQKVVDLLGRILARLEATAAMDSSAHGYFVSTDEIDLNIQ